MSNPQNNDVLLRVEHLCQYFGPTKAVDDVSFTIKKGEVFGLVGESGCGKTTTGRSIIKIYNITSGSIYFKDQRICAGTKSYRDEIAAQRKRIAELKRVYGEDALNDPARQAELKEFVWKNLLTVSDALIDLAREYDLYVDEGEIAENVQEEKEPHSLGLLALLLQGVATSIDALSVGFTIADYDLLPALICTALIAMVTFGVCTLGVELGKRFGTRFSHKAEILGGAILIVIGIEIFLTGIF